MIQREKYSYPADCWSFGVILHQLLSLERPFDGASTADLVKAILTVDPPILPSHYSEDIKYVNAPLCFLLLAFINVMFLEPSVKDCLERIPTFGYPHVLCCAIHCYFPKS